MTIPPTLDKYHNTIDSSSPDSIIIDYQYKDKQSSNRLHNITVSANTLERIKTDENKCRSRHRNIKGCKHIIIWYIFP